MKKGITILGIVALAVVFASLNVSALPVLNAVDFRSADWSGADGQVDYTVGNVVADARPDDPARLLWQDSMDGLGIQGLLDQEADEVEGRERLWIDLNASKIGQLT